jgi:hypothetical protein
VAHPWGPTTGSAASTDAPAGGLVAGPPRSPACTSAPPLHLAHGPLDDAEYLSHLDDDQAAGAAVGEARDIAGRLRCQPLLDRAAGLLSSPQNRGSGLDGDRTHPAAIRAVRNG